MHGISLIGAWCLVATPEYTLCQALWRLIKSEIRIPRHTDSHDSESERGNWELKGSKRETSKIQRENEHAGRKKFVQNKLVLKHKKERKKENGCACIVVM